MPASPSPFEPMNYRLIATGVGEALKWDASLKQIDRLARAILSLPKDSFPNDAITSQRAKLIYDWILTLASQSMAAEKRDELLVEFCQRISPTVELRAKVESILQSCGIQ